MKDNVFINAYLQQEENQLRRQADWRNQVIDDGKPKFVGNCQIWLGAMLGECEISEARAHVWEDGLISFVLPFKWDGMVGQIESGRWGRIHPIRPFTSNGPSASLSLGKGPSHEYKAFRISFELPTIKRQEETGGVYDETAQVIDEAVFGKFLLEASLRAEQYAQAQVERAEQALKNTINRLGWDLLHARDENAVNLAYQECMTGLPENQQQWDQQKQIRLEELKEEANVREQAAREQAEYLAARQELEALAESSFKPFVLYRIRYGATAQVIDYGEDGTEKEFHEVEDYSQAAEPDAEGWWTFLRWGQACRVKIARLIAVEEHPVNRAYDVPPATLKRVYVRSERYPEMSEETWDLTVLGL